MCVAFIQTIGSSHVPFSKVRTKSGLLFMVFFLATNWCTPYDALFAARRGGAERSGHSDS